jgi:hypothetical protein
MRSLRELANYRRADAAVQEIFGSFGALRIHPFIPRRAFVLCR